MEDGHWIGGLFADGSYAAGYPEAPEDIYIEQVWEMGPDGRFIGVLEDTDFEGHGALIRWDQIKVLEFFHLPKRSRN